MNRPTGMLSPDDLRSCVEQGAIETVLVVFTDHYGRWMGKRFDAHFFLEDGLEHGTHACDYLLIVDMEMTPVAGYAFANWERGFGDFHLAPDFATLRVASWLDKTAVVLCDVRNVTTHELVTVAPRSILRRQIERTKAAGFTAKAASELEYYLYRDSYRSAHEKGWRGLQPAGTYLEDYHTLQGTREEPFTAAARRHLRDSGVPVENSKGEWGLGQHELNVRYAEVLEMADRHGVYKQCLKEVADALGMSVTFMAKMSADQAGSSCHIHLSLWNDDANAFAGEATLGPVRCSATFRHFLGGWIAHTSELMPLYAPTVNSYKRYQAASWAPTGLAWSYDNRTTGFRVVGEGQSLRIECRLPGADANPYLAFAAALASGLDGVANKTEPPPIASGNSYERSDVARLPASLREAADRFEGSAFAREAFGADVVEHYAHFFHSEQDAFDKAVTDWERQRYFERI
ncbi:MAG TPA: glutamine synthetase family protein [Planctomycetota bacterium]|nr:glutamine synthetase family protein [Planctomycetota bacterium]